MANLEKVKQLREEAGVSFAECKKALEETGNDIEKAKEALRKRGLKLAGKKSEREAKVGIIECYLHPNKKVGVLLEIRAESDFVVKSPGFQELAHEICLHIAAMKPLYLKAGDIPEELLAGEKEIYEEQFSDSGKPKKVIDGIIEGKLEKYKEGASLLSQPWVKDQNKTIQVFIDEHIAKFGENIIIKRFARYDV